MKKKVDVFCATPFVSGSGRAPFAGKCLDLILEVDDIRQCLLNKAFVWELTKDGKRIPLDFSNYRLDNGGVVDDDLITSNDPRMRQTEYTNIELKQGADGKLEVAKKTEIVVQKRETPITVNETEKKEVVVEKKDPTPMSTSTEEEKKNTVMTEMDVTAKVEEEPKEEKNFNNNNNNKFDKHNKNKR